MNFFCIFFQKNLHISKKSCTFAPDLKNNYKKFNYIIKIKYFSQK